MSVHKHILLLDAFKQRIGLENDQLLISTDNEANQLIPLNSVESVIITKAGGSVSLKALQKIIQLGIGLSILDHQQKDTISICPKSPQAITLNRVQTNWCTNPQAKQFAQQVIEDKVWHQKQLLTEFKRRKQFQSLSSSVRQRVSLTLRNISQVLRQLKQLQTSSHDFKKSLFALEAKAAKNYWKAIALILPTSYSFTCRLKHGEGTDPLNAALNYGYAILASKLTQQLCGFGFDPHLGFLHADQQSRVSLTYDIIEKYRQRYVDVPILRYALSRSEWTLDKGDRLDRETKRDISYVVLEALDPRKDLGVNLIISDIRSLRTACLSQTVWKPTKNTKKGLSIIP